MGPKPFKPIEPFEPSLRGGLSFERGLKQFKRFKQFWGPGSWEVGGWGDLSSEKGLQRLKRFKRL